MAILLAISLVLSGSSGLTGLRPAGLIDGDRRLRRDRSAIVPVARKWSRYKVPVKAVARYGSRRTRRLGLSIFGRSSLKRVHRPHLMQKSLGATPAIIVRLASSDLHPVTGVSFAKIECFAQWLSSKKGRHYRLPTEAEWERFARSGVKTQYPWGNTLLPERAALRLHTAQRGNQMMEIGLNAYEGLPVRSFPPN